MNRRKTTPLIISIVAAVLGALLLMMYAKSNSKGAPKEPTVALAKVKTLIPKGTPLAALTAANSSLVEEVPFPQSAAPQGALTIAGLKGLAPDQLALTEINPGETILPNRFAPRAAIDAERVPDAAGKLQITIALNSERVLNGFDLKPGDKVAVLATLTGKKVSNDKTVVTTTIVGESAVPQEQSTKILLRKVTLIRLIAPAGIAPTTVAGAVPVGDPAIVEGHWYAKLAVTPEEAQKVVYAMQVGGGSVWLALDPDSVPVQDGPYWNPDATNQDNIFLPVVTAPDNPLVSTTTIAGASAPSAAAPAPAPAATVPGQPTRPGQPAAAPGSPTTVKK